MKVDQDYTIIRINDKEFEIKQTNFAKVIMGISLPQFGSVMLPTRTASNVIEVGFTNV